MTSSTSSTVSCHGRLTPASVPVSILDSEDQSSSPTDNILNNTNTAPRRHRSGLFLAALIMMLSLATILAVLFVPRDEHSPRMLMHPLSSIKHSQPQQEDSVRYLTFGSSSTWGEGLEEPQHQAYPWLLSPSVHNVAARVGGISLSAICTQSIVGGGIYDVITIEFMDSDAEGVVQLAQRIRERFPSAQLVFVRLWTPATHVVYDDTLSLLEWWNLQQPKQQPQLSATEEEEDDQLPSLLSSFEFQAALLNSDPKRWSFVDYSQRAVVVDAAIEEVNGMLYELPSPASSSSTEPVPLGLTSPTYTTLFQDNRPQLLSSNGHQLVAQGIQQLLKQQPQQTTSARNQAGSWGTGDACAMWYGTGDYSALRSRRRASLVDFSKSNDGYHKHAVEISRRGGSIEVTNPFSEPRMLYLTYMTATPSGEGQPREYPRTKVSLGSKKSSVLIDPVHDNNLGDQHLTRTTAVGLVPPGRTAVKLGSLDADSTSRFRLVGHHFLAQGKVPIPFEFDLEPDAAHR